MTHHATRTLQEQGYRLTPQRTMVWDVLRSQQSHLSAEQICTRVQETFPNVNLSTVYRTLELLVALGLVRETCLGPGTRLFEVEEDVPHHHLVCEGCGTVIHVHDEDLDGLGDTLKAAKLFTLREATLFGYCSTCRPEVAGGFLMHVPDGFVDLPTAAVAGAVALGAVAVSVRKATRQMNERTVPLLGVTAAFVFAAQMLNFPIAGGTSGHFLGAVFVAVLLGPYAAVVVLTSVLAVQALVMADGGITALGVNVLNMAVIGGMVGYLVFLGLKRLLPKSVTGYFFAVAIASWFSVVLASAACSLELALSGTVPLSVALPAMTSVHMVIGIGEALITATVVAAVLATRPDLVKTFDRRGGSPAPRRGALVGRRGRVWAWALAGLALALALAVFVSPFASSSPDGLEKVAANQGFEQAASQPAWDFSPIPDYSFPGIHSTAVATAVAGAVGTIALFVIVLLIGRAVGRGGPAVPVLRRASPSPVSAGGRDRSLMSSRIFTERQTGRSPLHRLDPRAKIIGFLAFVVVVVSTPARAFWAFAAYALILAFLVGFSRLRLGHVLKRMLVVVPFVILVAIFLPFFDRSGSGGYSLGFAHVSSDGLLVLWNAGAKAILAVLSVVLLGSTTAFPDMVGGFQRLHVPQVFVLVVSFMYRYAHVFLEELRRMQRAMAARNYRGRWLWNVPILGQVLGSLFLRSYNRGERVYVAMISRGYEGTINLSSAQTFGIAESAFLGALILAAASVRLATLL